MALSELDSLQGAIAAYEAVVRLEGGRDFETLRQEIRAGHDVSVRTRDDKKEDWQEFMSMLERFSGLRAWMSNDRLLLDLKGAISEFELQGIKDRLQGGRLNKALHGELALRLPIGFVYTDDKAVVLDPDESIVEAIKPIFATFRSQGSITQTTKWLQIKGLRVPTQRPYPRGTLHWNQPHIAQIRRILRSPRYAGCYAYGRWRTQLRPDGAIKYISRPM